MKKNIKSQLTAIRVELDRIITQSRTTILELKQLENALKEQQLEVRTN
jgi:hypothetical protein